MPQILSDAVIRRKVAAYLAGELSISAFNSWFIPATWDVEATGSEATRELVYDILLSLAEYTSGHLTELDLKDKFTSHMPLSVASIDSVDKPSYAYARPGIVANRVQNYYSSQTSSGGAKSQVVTGS